MKKTQLGYTLIEVLVSLLIFAIIGSITSQILFSSFNTKEIVNAHSKRLEQLQLTLLLLHQDLRQLSPRAITLNKTQQQYALEGTTSTLAFTRGGNVMPLIKSKRSTLLRVKYEVTDKQLTRKIYSRLDTSSPESYQQMQLLPSIKKFALSYFDKHHQSHDSWQQAKLPTAIKIEIMFDNNNTISQVFPINIGKTYARSI